MSGTCQSKYRTPALGPSKLRLGPSLAVHGWQCAAGASSAVREGLVPEQHHHTFRALVWRGSSMDRA